MAEVLITLVIIGVIGALTVPALIQNTQKQEYIAGVKKAYSMLSQVTQQIISEEGSPKCDDGGWACSNEDVYRMYKKYFNNIREALDDTSIYRNNPDTRPRIILADGFIVRFHAYSKSCQYTANGSRNVCAYMDVDVNGEKKPNIVGRDIFDFSLKENGLFPSGCDYAGACGSNGGYGCTCKVLTENAINY